MKNSLKKLRGLGIHKHNHHLHHDSKGSRDFQSLAQLDELAQAAQDMQDMRGCYDSLLSAAAATANSAYEFSESLREMGSCLLQKTALNDDEESGRVLLMLGKLQFKLGKLVDNYRGHIIKTITTPSESLMNELQTVEEMKRQCDDKRDVYEQMITRYKERGKSRAGKADSFTLQQLQTAHDEYDQEATLFVFRLKSLKQGQSRSLLTQAARHHAAQLHFFKKSLQSLETVEPHVKSVTEQQHIDYPFSGLEDDDGDDGEYDDESYDENDDGELSLDYGHNEQDRDVSTPQNSKEEEKLDKLNRNSVSFRFRPESQSAPLFIDKPDFSEKLRQMPPSLSRRFSSYVLPTPVNAMSSSSSGSSNLTPSAMHINSNEPTKNLWHSSPLEQKKYGENFGDEKFSGSTVANAQSVLKESNSNIASTRVPPPLVDGLLSSTHDPFHVHSKKIKRHAFSGPLTGKPWPTKHASLESVQLFSGPLLQTPIVQPSSSPPKISPSASPTFTSSPKISELHELPRPPAGFSSNSSRLVGLMGHSGPLVSRGPKHSAANKLVTSNKNAASPLPTPPQAMARSFSIPTSSARAEALHDPRPLESPNRSSISEDHLASPPVVFTSSQLFSDDSDTVAQGV